MKLHMKRGKMIKNRISTKKISWKSIFLVTKTEYIRGIMDARNLVVCSMFLVFYEMILKDFIHMSEKMGKPIHLLEPFIAVCSSDAVMIMLPIVFFILISDFPRREDNFQYFISRCGKVNWLLGQLMYSVLLAFSYLGTLVIITSILATPYSYMGNQWSEVATKYYIVFPEEKDTMVNELINGTLYNHSLPMEAFFQSVLLYALYFILLSVISILMFVYQKQIYGFLINGVIVVAGGISAFCDFEMKWLLPSAHAIVWQHYGSVLKTESCTITDSYLYYLIVISVGILFIFRRLKTWNVIE